MSGAPQRWQEVGGFIHAASSNGNDVTFCGYALEGAAFDSADDQHCVPASRGKINCPNCLLMIRTAKAISARYLEDPGHG